MRKLRKNFTFSVVIPTYNSSATLARALGSVITQTRLPNEIIIVDDASSDFDTTSIIVKQFQSLFTSIRLLRNKTNINGAASRNRGIRLSKYEYIAFLDSDDEWLPNKLEIYHDYISIYGRSHLYFSQRSLFKDNVLRDIHPKRGIDFDEHISEYLFLTGGVIQTSTIVMDRSAVLNVMFDARFNRHQDHDFCLRAIQSGIKPIFINKPLTIFHIIESDNKLVPPSFCRWWLDKHKWLMNKHGYWGYRLFILSLSYLRARKYYNFLINLLLSIYNLGVKGVWKIRHKFTKLKWYITMYFPKSFPPLKGPGK